MKRIAIVVAVVLGLGAAVYLLFFRASDEDVIRSQLTRLTKAVRISEESSNPITRLAHVRGEFKEVFEKDVRANIQELGSARTGRDALADLAMGASSMARKADVELSRIEIKIDDARRTAHVKAIATISGIQRDGDTRSDERAVDMQLTKNEGTWKIASLTVWSKADAPPR